MNEQNLRDGLRSAMADTVSPPPMDPIAALDTARAARKRRHGVRAGAAVAAAVVALLAGVTVAVSGTGGPTTPAGAGGATPPAATPPVTEDTEDTKDTEDTESAWPTGPDGEPQQDRTASAGPRFEQGAQLLVNLVAVVPPGYTVPTTTPTDPPDADGHADYHPSNDPWARLHQSQFVDRVGDVEVWEHLASLAVFRDGGAGHLLVTAHTPGSRQPADLCQASLWGAEVGSCDRLRVGDHDVAVVRRATGPAGGDFDEWAVHRHADGAVVVIGQTVRYRGADAPLSAPVFTPRQLAELAVDERFHLT